MPNKTTFTSTGRLRQGCWVEVEAEDMEGTPLGWVPVQVVGSLQFGDRTEYIIEFHDGGRQPMNPDAGGWRSIH